MQETACVISVEKLATHHSSQNRGPEAVTLCTQLPIVPLVNKGACLSFRMATKTCL